MDSAEKERIQFAVLRSAAIHSYANVERQAADVMRVLVGCEPDIGFIIFFRISNTNARYGIISDLMKRWNDGKYSKSWANIEKWMRPLDSMRNQIVHWTLEMETDWESETPIYTVLANSIPGSKAPRLASEDLNRAIDRFREMQTIMMVFFRCLMNFGMDPIWEEMLILFGDSSSPAEFLQTQRNRQNNQAK